MGKEVLTFGNIEIEKKIFFTVIRLLFFLVDVDAGKVLVSNKISFGKKKTKITLLVTCIMVIKLNH